jgi:hypothetical protein
MNRVVVATMLIAAPTVSASPPVAAKRGCFALWGRFRT